ncbi:MAG: hypothetical protein KC910_00165 [Candidatus Eremiobacteraeota bacterium]|nr:hypothetical protein [Candidatus Eremiobacteraeota bacterium]
MRKRNLACFGQRLGGSCYNTRVEEQQSSTLRRAIGLGCVVTLLLSAMCTGGTCWYTSRDLIVLNPHRVELAADRILPGARALPGYRGVYASKVSVFECAILTDARTQGQTSGAGPYHGMAFRIFSLRRPKDTPRWDRLEPQIRTAPGGWGAESSHEDLELTVDGRKVPVRRFHTVDGALGYRLNLLTRERMVTLIVVGPEDKFSDQDFRRFLSRLDLDRAPARNPFKALPVWLLGLFAVLGAALITVGLYILKETGPTAYETVEAEEGFDL